MSEVLSILMVNYNRLDYLKGTVQSVFDTTDRPFELLIWDNASTEVGMSEYLKELAKRDNVKVFSSPKNIGVWAASNQLISRARSRMTLGFVKMDNDCIIQTKGWADKWIQCCVANPQIGMMGANIEGKKERSPDTESVELNGHKLLILTAEGTGGMVYVPGKIFQQLGFYNEEYGRYGHADKDYARRIMTLGYEFAYHRDVQVGRFAVNNDDQVGGYREHKNLYVRRNRKLYVLNRYLYQNRFKSLAIWYKKFESVVSEAVKSQPIFCWADEMPKVRWEDGKVTPHVTAMIEKYRLTGVKK